MSNENSTEEQNESEDVKVYNLSERNGVLDMFRDELSDDQIKFHAIQYLNQLIKDHKMDKYCVVFLCDDHYSINTYHSNKIYKAISHQKKPTDILLVLQSGGGKIEPAYLISKTCKRLSKKKFIVSIPRMAKSAATLISLGATELHMGFLSELGPIDPQFGGFPASGLANAMEKIAEMSEKFPGSSDLLAKYLTDNLNIKDLGYFERINESAAQYAERLLKGKKFPENWTEETIADHFTNHYKDHGFVVDSDEASSLLGKGMIKENTGEYDFGNSVFEFLDFLDVAFRVFRSKNLRLVGGLEEGLDLNEEKKK